MVKIITDRDNMMARIDRDEPVDLTIEEAASAVKTLLKTKEVKISMPGGNKLRVIWSRLLVYCGVNVPRV